MRKTLIALLILFAASYSYADTTSNIAGQKRFHHQAGVQINELVRQIFNFSGNAVNSNPYLFTYSINHARTGLGVRTGVGYSYQSFTNDDGITRRTSDLTDLRGRLGLEVMFNLSRRWTAGAGIDGIFDHNDDFTRSVVRGFDTVTTITSTKITSFGGGPMLWLRYHITSRVLIGTESSFYYLGGQENSTVSITKKQFVGGSQRMVTTTTSIDSRREDARITVPIAFFLVVRF